MAISPTTSPSSAVPDETASIEQSRSANWKTYTNSRFNFSFQYPEEWELREQPKGLILIITEDEKQYPIKFNLADLALPDSDEYKDEETTIDNAKFTKQTGFKNNSPTFITLYPKNLPQSPNDLFGIEFIVPPTNQQKFINQFNQLLRSIKL